MEQAGARDAQVVKTTISCTGFGAKKLPANGDRCDKKVLVNLHKRRLINSHFLR